MSPTMNPKYRNMFLQVLLMIVTCGLYSFYWFYETSKELQALSKDDTVAPALWTVLLFFPPLTFYSHYKYAETYQKVSRDHFNLWILFLLWIVFFPAVWFICQSELNHLADPVRPHLEPQAT